MPRPALLPMLPQPCLSLPIGRRALHDDARRIPRLDARDIGPSVPPRRPPSSSEPPWCSVPEGTAVHPRSPSRHAISSNACRGSSSTSNPTTDPPAPTRRPAQPSAGTTSWAKPSGSRSDSRDAGAPSTARAAASLSTPGRAALPATSTASAAASSRTSAATARRLRRAGALTAAPPACTGPPSGTPHAQGAAGPPRTPTTSNPGRTASARTRSSR